MAKCKGWYKFNKGIYDYCVTQPRTGNCFYYKVTDDKCNIIKPKPKLKRVKAWVAINRDGDMYSVWLPIHKGEMHKDIYKPCTILIDEKYLKGKGGKK